jgi:trans-aconitate methyltransferase
MMTISPEFYDQGWPTWDDMKVHGPTARHTRRLIFKLLDGLSFESVLDAGCGTGVLLKQMLERYPHVKFAGSEYSPEGLDLARQRLPQTEFYSIDLGNENIPKKFDLVTCIDVLEHVNYDLAALKNLHAMTGKYLVLSVPLGRLMEIEARRMGHVHGYGRQELENKIRQAGFEIIKAIQWGFPFYNIHRRLANHMPVSTTTGDFSPKKKLLTKILYGLFFLNIAPGGERYYVLCRLAIDK